MASFPTKPWKNSACVILLSGPLTFCEAPQKITNPVTVRNKPFLQYTSEHNDKWPEIIFVKRHSKSSVMANVDVFPGGVIEKADYSPSWMSLFSKYSHPFNSILSLRDSGLPIFKTVPSSSPIPGEVAFRICAIRELFEEAGILLARHQSEMKFVLDVVPGSFPPSISSLPRPVLEEWRSRVHSDASQFITMCKEFDLVPDIWSLIEWSDWLTPRNIKRRYDTIFYICYCGEKPEASPDHTEVIDAKWISPTQVDNVLAFAPPQVAEVKTLLSMFELGGVPLAHLFSLQQSIKDDGIYCRRASRILTGNGYISVSNEDDLFPHDPEDNITPVQFPKSSELKRRGVTLRLSLTGNFEYQIPEFTSEQLRQMSVNISRMDEHLDFSDGIEVKRFTKFLASIERTKL